MKNLESDLWQNLHSPLEARTHLHNVEDYHHHGDDDGAGDQDDDGDDDDDGGDDNDDDGGDKDDEDTNHLTALLHFVFVEVGVKIIPQSPSPSSNCLKSLFSLSSPC